jgi:hypothetical protein
MSNNPADHSADLRNTPEFGALVMIAPTWIA